MTAHHLSFSISTLSSPLISATDLASIASREPFSGVELDLSEHLRYRLQGWSRAGADTRRQVRVIWLPADATDSTSDRLGRMLDGQTMTQSPLIIVDTPRKARPDRFEQQLQVALQVKGELDDSTQIAIGIRPHPIESTRSHLATLSTCRMRAAEWDIGLALDLSRGLDWLWEAEAAIYRIVSNLKLVRLSYSHHTFDGRFRASLTHRSVAACAEMEYAGKYSVVAPLPWWHWRNAPALEATGREAAAGVRRRYASTFSLDHSPIDVSRMIDPD